MTVDLGGGGDPAPHPRPSRPQIGVAAAPDTVHPVTRPGLYGVSDPAPGTQYAVIGSSLVRVDTATRIVRSVIRGGVRPVD